MISKANESAGAAIKHAIETRNANMLSKLYTDSTTTIRRASLTKSGAATPLQPSGMTSAAAR